MDVEPLEAIASVALIALVALSAIRLHGLGWGYSQVTGLEFSERVARMEARGIAGIAGGIFSMYVQGDIDYEEFIAKLDRLVETIYNSTGAWAQLNASQLLYNGSEYEMHLVNSTDSPTPELKFNVTHGLYSLPKNRTSPVFLVVPYREKVYVVNHTTGPGSPYWEVEDVIVYVLAFWPDGTPITAGSATVEVIAGGESLRVRSAPVQNGGAKVVVPLSGESYPGYAPIDLTVSVSYQGEIEGVQWSFSINRDLGTVVTDSLPGRDEDVMTLNETGGESHHFQAGEKIVLSTASWELWRIVPIKMSPGRIPPDYLWYDPGEGELVRVVSGSELVVLGLDVPPGLYVVRHGGGVNGAFIPIYIYPYSVKFEALVGVPEG